MVTLTVRTPRAAQSVGLGVDGAEREECRLLQRGRWLCTMPGDVAMSLRLGIVYPFVLLSTTRVCSGSCPTRDGAGLLDQRRHTCRSRIEVQRGDRLRATVVTRVGERCRIRRR